MKFHIMVKIRLLWESIENRYIHRNRAMREYIIEETKIELSNDQAMNNFFSSLSENKFNRVRACRTTKEVKEKLRVHYKGKHQVKKKLIIEGHYETFSWLR
ncbi:hypothetical protein Syun_007294 [Stephania yunnanensis]|uniref:Uncharacterized protein n=1 Tax=Stephania yunnanensis TaxID=152371 RepID=A0AAP0KZQ2_9MAGN